MASALAQATTLKAEIRLAQAVSLFEADLPPDQKASLRAHRSQSRASPPNVQDVMRLTAEIDRGTLRKVGGGRCFGPRFTNVLQAVQQFAALGDVIIGGSQNIVACGVWSVVRMTLLVSETIFSLSGFPSNVHAVAGSLHLLVGETFDLSDGRRPFCPPVPANGPGLPPV